MAVVSATAFPIIQASLVSNGLTGPSNVLFAQGLASSLAPFLLTIPVNTVHVGIVGTGTGTGKVTLLAPQGIAIIGASLASVGIIGPSAPILAKAVAQGVSQVITGLAQVQVALAGTSTGTGTGTLFAANAASYYPILLSSFTASGLRGPTTPLLAQGLSQGIAQWFKTGIVNTVDVGTPVPPFVSVSGTGIGKVF